MRTWNYFNHDGPHTNNHVEGWHNRLKKMAQKAHPYLFEFIEVIQKEQAATEVSYFRTLLHFVRHYGIRHNGIRHSGTNSYIYIFFFSVSSS